MNDGMRTRVLTRRQREKERRRGHLEKNQAVGRNRSESAERGLSTDDFADIDLNSTDVPDPHSSHPFRPPAPLYKPFSSKPHLSLDLLPLGPEQLLIGRKEEVNVVVQVGVKERGVTGEEEQAPAIERCVLHIATNDSLRLFRQNHSAGANGEKAIAPEVCGLLLTGDGKQEQKKFTVNVLTGDIQLGSLPAGCRLLLLLPIRTPQHLTHLLQTKQITLPASSVAGTPHASRPVSPTNAHGNRRLSMKTPRRMSIGAGETDTLEEGDKIDLHSIQLPFSMDLTCAPVSTEPLVPSAPPLPSFMFSSSHTLTFMEPLQLLASMERLGHRWFLQVYVWNRCSFPVQVKGYQLTLPRGFVLRRDANEGTRDYVLPPLPLSDHFFSSAPNFTLSAGASAAAAAASVPITYASPNVWSMVFELAVEEEGTTVAQSADAALLAHHRTISSADEVDEEASFEVAFASSAVGRFSLQVDTNPSVTPPASNLSSSPQYPLTSPTLLSLSWPISISSMVGAHDLHLLLAFPPRAHQGRMIKLDVTVMRVQTRERRGRGRGAAMMDTSSADAKTTPMHLLYTLIAPSNLWLTAGKSSQSFSLVPGEQRSFSVQLLPIASGYLPIPFVELQEQIPPEQQGSETLSKVAEGAIEHGGYRGTKQIRSARLHIGARCDGRVDRLLRSDPTGAHPATFCGQPSVARAAIDRA